MNKITARNKNRKLVIASMLGAITIVLGMTPLGLIPLGFINATTMHIPVIIAAIAEGPIVGALVGLIFGISSLLNAILKNASPVAFVFYNPLISIVPRVLIGITSYYSYAAMKKTKDKNLKILTKILWGIVTLLLILLLVKDIKTGASTINITFVVILLALCIGLFIYSLKSNEIDFPIAIGAFVGSMTNTILVLGGIYLIYAKRYVEALNIPMESAKSAILGVSVTSGIPEAIISVIVTTAVIKALKSKRS
ncbi:ECF transporter S component [Peptoniphilus rhinitidis]|uniref:ECF transporter S component n=1 Tax=Peptoniphilus rhinitidis TaxID=1175452 RepID=UPI00290197E1|nr:ECF transporter S component [Peptoniphilus rhinitidis]MDU1042945.1 ECF transporter S component [Peptoniphilus rhinitidis]MDU2109335.1 ECF transporter S component [Peptoniphilus lacydonensis]MDU3750224.1 ECF transporter S component [Peptoniphilus rhinitidis]